MAAEEEAGSSGASGTSAGELRTGAFGAGLAVEVAFYWGWSSGPREDDRAGEARGLLPLLYAGGGAAMPGCWVPEGAAAPSSFFFTDSVGLTKQEENVRK